MSVTIKTCETCAAFDKGTGECHRHAPILLPPPAPSGDYYSIGPACGWPWTHKDLWCCEWLPIPAQPQS
jgi:hypothetical protein